MTPYNRINCSHSEYRRNHPGSWYGTTYECPKRATWKISATSIGGGYDGTDYHWTAHVCDEHLDERISRNDSLGYVVNTRALSLPSCSDRWATLLMIREYAEAHSPESVRARLEAAEEHMGRVGHTGDGYAFRVLRKWWEDTSSHEDRFLMAAWDAAGAVIAAEHGRKVWTLQHHGTAHHEHLLCCAV